MSSTTVGLGKNEKLVADLKVASYSKRYTVMNKHIQGSNALPQSAHALNNLWKGLYDGKFSEQAHVLFTDWAFNSQVEIYLRGGTSKSLEDLYSFLQKVPEIPSAKFNESEDDLNGACTAVTFVATDRVVAGGNYVRALRLNPYNIKFELSGKSIPSVDGEEHSPLTEEEIEIVSAIAFLGLC